MYIYRYAAQGEMKLLGSHAPKRAQFTCFTGTKVQILTPEAQSSIRDEAPAPTKNKKIGGAAHVQENKFIFFFHAAQVEMRLLEPPPKRAQFTCFTSTEVQILTPEAQLK